MKNIIPIKKSDVLKSVYFIADLAQTETGQSMHGALSSKGDLIGGIFDRWINTFPEALVFNKGILPSIADGHKVEIISDFYQYNPAIAGIAPDVIGLKVDGETVPFVVFEDSWKPIEGAPQIEIKTFKQPQKMVSLRNQGYNNKFLVMVESNFRIDYLVPFFDKAVFGDDVYQELNMDDRKFIVRDTMGLINHFPEISSDFDQIGTVSILAIMTADDFMSNATLCEGRVSVQRIDSIEECDNARVGNTPLGKLSDFAHQLQNGLYRFNNNWYDGVEDDIPYYLKSSAKHKTRALDFSCQNINDIAVLKKSKSNFYIKASTITSINGKVINKDKIYKISCSILDREGNEGEEYFFQKELLDFIPSKENELKNQIKRFIK